MERDVKIQQNQYKNIFKEIWSLARFFKAYCWPVDWLKRINCFLALFYHRRFVLTNSCQHKPFCFTVELGKNDFAMVSTETKDLIVLICIWFYPFIFVFGVIGNALAFIVFSRKKLAKSSFSVYFRFLAVSDSIALIDSVNNFAKYGFHSAIADRSDLMCKTFHYLCDTMELSSGMCIRYVLDRWTNKSNIIISYTHTKIAWFYVLISLDRLISISYSKRFPIFGNKMFQIVTSISIYLTCFGFDLIEVFYYWHYTPFTKVVAFTSGNVTFNQTVRTGGCVWIDPTNIFTCLYLIMEAILPFILMIIFSSISIGIISRSRNRLLNANMSSMRRNTRKSIVFKNHDKEKTPNNSSLVSCASDKSTRKSKWWLKNKDFKFAITSIVLNISFLVLNSPSNFLYVFVYFIKLDFDFIYVITQMFYHSHFALIFYINFFLNSIFKQECILMFKTMFNVNT